MRSGVKKKETVWPSATRLFSFQPVAESPAGYLVPGNHPGGKDCPSVFSPGREAFPPLPGRYQCAHSAKKSFPLSSTMMNAGKFSTRISRMASMPSSSKATTFTLLMLSLARIAAGPPMEPR